MSERILSSRSVEALFATLSFLVLVLCGTYASIYLQLTGLGLQWDPRTWEVAYGHEDCADPGRCLVSGDRILTINGVTGEAFRARRDRSEIDWTGDLRVQLIRGEREMEVIFGRSELNLSSRIHAVVATSFPLLLWLMGTVAVIFLRPRNTRWLVLVLFYYCTAVMFAAGFISFSHLAYSSVLLHILMWLFCPLAIHLHLLLPTELFARRRGFIPLLYLVAAVLAVLDLLYIIPGQLFLFAVLFGLLISLTLLFYRQLQPVPRPIRVANRLMLFGVGIGVGPWIGMLIVFSTFRLAELPLDLNNALVAAAALVAVPNWPLAYIYAIYKYEIGSIQLRANRLLGAYSFVSVYVLLFVGTFYLVGVIWPGVSDHPILTSLLMSVTFVVGAPPIRGAFQTVIDRHIFGIRYKPSEVIALFAARIPTAFDRGRLKRLIVGDILPTLLIRQSALYLLADDEIEPVYEQGVTPATRLLRGPELPALLARGERFIQASEAVSERYRWVRLVMPLSIEDQHIGIWLFGERDPDDFYPTSDVNLLRNLANQVATVVRAQQEIIENSRLHQQLLHAQKMEALGRLSAGIAHDFNNLLSAILGYGDLLLSRHRGDRVSKKYLTGIIDAGEKAEGLIRQLLSFSRRQRSEVEVVDVDQVIRDMDNLVRRLLSDDIRLRTELGATHCIRIDPRQLEQVMLNLVVNAGDAMPDGGRLSIETSDHERKAGEPHPHSDLEAGAYVRIRVRDTGTGIDPEVQTRIFEPFFTTKDTGKGTGLGLSTAYGIVRQGGGHIYAESIEGQGTTFYLYLPAVGQLAEAGTRTRTASTGRGTGTETVLVVEDEETVRTVVCEILRARGYTVLHAEGGPQALAVSARYPHPIDLLLSDVMMPHMKGPELAERLTAQRAEMRVLYMSGYSEDATLGATLRIPGAPLVQKPFLPEALVRAVRAVLDVEIGAPSA